jgi:hypothetical protein
LAATALDDSAKRAVLGLSGDDAFKQRQALGMSGDDAFKQRQALSMSGDDAFKQRQQLSQGTLLVGIRCLQEVASQLHM